MLRISALAVRRLLATALAVFFSNVAVAEDGPLENLDQSFNDLIYSVSRSVVSIEANRHGGPSALPIAGSNSIQRQLSSGLVIDSFGHVLVAAEMVVNPDRIIVGYADRAYDARLVGIDYRTGLALLSADKLPGLPVAVSPRQVCAGQMVLTVANAPGQPSSPSVGFCAGARVDGMIQFTVPFLPGLVGGGVFDMAGQLLGVVLDSTGGGSQLALAVPGYLIPEIAAHLIEHGDRAAGFIGVSSAEIEISPGIDVYDPTVIESNTAATRLVEHGVVITQVIPTAPADRAGLRIGDIIIQFDRKEVVSAAELARWVLNTTPGTLVDLEVIRRSMLIGLQVVIDHKRLGSSYANQRSRDNGADDQRLIDSLQQALTDLRNQVDRLERRITGMKR